MFGTKCNARCVRDHYLEMFEKLVMAYTVKMCMLEVGDGYMGLLVLQHDYPGKKYLLGAIRMRSSPIKQNIQK